MFETLFFLVSRYVSTPGHKKNIVLNIVLLHQADLQRYLFGGGKGMFLRFYVKKNVPGDTLLRPAVLH